MMNKEMLKPVFALTGIALVMAFVLAMVNQVTSGPINDAKNNQELEAIAIVAGDFDNNPFAEKRDVYTLDKKEKFIMYPAYKEGKLNAVAIKSYSNSGFGGKIEVMTGFNVDGSIKTFKIISSKETPGLGSKTDEPKFKEQLKGFDPAKKVLKVKQDGGDVDAVTAATISSRAVLRAIERAFDAFNNYKRDDNE